MTKQNVRLFLALWSGTAVVSVAYTLLFTGALSVILGASPQELNENLDFASLPLGWVNSRWVIRATTPLPIAIGIVLINCYFYAAILFPIVKIVRRVQESNRVTRLSITETPNDEDHDSEG